MSGMATVVASPLCPQDPAPGTAARITTIPQRDAGVSGTRTSVQEAMLRRAGSSDQGMEPRTLTLTRMQKAKWCATARAVTQQMRRMHFSADNSTFSALNVDGICMPRPAVGKLGELVLGGIAGGRPAKLEALVARLPGGHNPPADQRARTGKLAQPLKQLKGVSGPERDMEASSEASTEAAATDPAFGEQGPRGEESDEASSGLGVFFMPPNGRQGKSRRASSTTLEAAMSSPEPLEQTNEQEASGCMQAAAAAPVRADGDDAAASLSFAKLEPTDPRGLLLSFRSAAGPAPVELQGLSTEVRKAIPVVSLASHMGLPARQTSAPAQTKSGLPARQVSAPAMDPCAFALVRQISSPAPSALAERRPDRSRAPSSPMALPTPSATAYRAGAGRTSPLDELRRSVKCSLNKVCPENVTTIAARISEIEIHSAEELQEVISIIFQKALSEPHYCATYADLVFNIKSEFPEFASPDGGRPQTFRSLLVDVCQKEFEMLPHALELSGADVQQCDDEELEHRRKKAKDRLLANMKIIGHLFLRQILSPRVITAIIQELTLAHGDYEDRLPEAYCIECVVELLMSVGHTLEAMPVGKQAIAQVCSRLLDLKQRRGAGGCSAYSRRIQFAIQDVLDIRMAGWARKVFSGVARTKEEIRREQQRDHIAQAHGREVEGGQVVISGQRPEYIKESKTVA
uniref:MIF4G domain-containing protein n=1 Tax=Alexandrium monilatum TaxID=311494 RepID=A0A7S4VQK0_9DINO